MTMNNTKTAQTETAQAGSVQRMVIPPSYAALRRDYKRQVMREFMGGTSTRALCNRHSLTKAVVEQIIRSQMRKAV